MKPKYNFWQKDVQLGCCEILLKSYCYSLSGADHKWHLETETQYTFEKIIHGI